LLEKAGQHDLRFIDTLTSDLFEEETRKNMLWKKPSLPTHGRLQALPSRISSVY